MPKEPEKMRMRLQQYDYKIVAKSGKDIPVADALSRAYLPETKPKLDESDFCVYAEPNGSPPVLIASLDQENNVKWEESCEVRC